MQAYLSLNRDPLSPRSIVYSYAKQLYDLNKLEQAQKALDAYRNEGLNYEETRLSAQIYAGLQMDSMAEQTYQMVIAMIPNRMQSRFDLFNFYKSVGYTSKAISMAASIVKMQVKIPSSRTHFMQQEAQTFINNNMLIN
jgi:thioredoxin-like negative regulator of GroEL